jgi:glutathione reductase (NADPH)
MQALNWLIAPSSVQATARLKRAFADTEFGNFPRTISHANVASAVFSQPEAATVGLSEEEARAQFGDGVKVYRAKFRPMFHSLTGADEKVMVKLVVEGDHEKILGVHMVGDSAAEIIQGMAIAVKMGAHKKDFDATIGIHPSTAEEFVTMR